MEPASHFFRSHRLRLQLWDYGQDGKPPLILTHGGLDHARNWDFAARRLRERFRVYAWDLRGHGNSEWAFGASYGVMEHVLDLAALVEVVVARQGGGEVPVRLIGHSLGGVICSIYTATFPERVSQLVNLEGWGPPPSWRRGNTEAERLRAWIEEIRQAEKREARAYPSIEAAVSRMRQVNAQLSDEVAHHLTVHGTNWNADGSLVWKFDNFVRVFPPAHRDDLEVLMAAIRCPSLLFWGTRSFITDPETDPRPQAIPDKRIVKLEGAGHWLHHDRLDEFLKPTLEFLR